MSNYPAEGVRQADIVEKVESYPQYSDYSRAEKLKLVGQWRNKYRLWEKWHDALDAYDGPGEGCFVEDYRWRNSIAFVGELGGLIVWDAGGRAHHFRLYCDETVRFIESPEDPDAHITIDPLTADPDDTVYLTTGLGRAVTEHLEALEVTPRWQGVCRDGAHEFETVNEGHHAEFVRCEVCGNSRSTLSWLGHAVPVGDADVKEGSR